ncbi:MAG: response regulator transcription factor [Flavobacterium sp.]|nr:MAG: response regulator transcription factor [Flavobacterium sp.]
MGLTQVDHKTLELIALGYSYKEIADKLSLSEKAVEKIKLEMLSKTKSRNSASLISFAYKYGLLKV